VSALAGPDSVDQLWVEQEYDELTQEQMRQWEASGEIASRPAQRSAAGLGMQADVDEWLTSTHAEVVQAAQDRLLRTLSALSAHRRRAKGMKVWYRLAKLCFVLGDAAGFASAAIWLGEAVEIALTLGVSAAVATVAAGLIGVEIRDHRDRQRRHRPPDSLAEHELPFAHLFTKDDPGSGLLRRVVTISAMTTGMIGLGIGALRASVDDPLIGSIFAGIALAVAGGSFLVSYAGADVVGDLIDHAEADYAAAVRTHQRLSTANGSRERAEAMAEAASVTSEHAQRGQAAADHVRALKARILRQNPHVAGHGPSPSVVPVGRTVRKEQR
jgi:hypothetical protein